MDEQRENKLHFQKTKQKKTPKIETKVNNYGLMILIMHKWIPVTGGIDIANMQTTSVYDHYKYMGELECESIK